MFENLSDKLQRVFKNLRGEGKLTPENMEAALREIRVALLEADVHFRVAKQFIEAVKERAMGQEVLTALSPPVLVLPWCFASCPTPNRPTYHTASEPRPSGSGSRE